MLDQSTLTYHVSHPLHQIDGVSHAAKGKGICQDGQCNFLIAVPVKSFDSGDSNRDLHMLQVTRGAEFPLVTVRTRVPESAVRHQPTINLDLEIQFAGQTVRVQAGSFPTGGARKRDTITGTIPAKITDFKIDPAVAPHHAHQERIPVSVELTWHIEVKEWPRVLLCCGWRMQTNGNRRIASQQRLWRSIRVSDAELKPVNPGF